MNHYAVLKKILAERFGEPKIGAEVGVWQGKNANHLLKRFPGLHLILVDSYDDAKLTRRLANTSTAREARGRADERLARHAGRFTWLPTPSVEAAELVRDGSLDFAFVDADHHYDAVTADIEAWLPKVRDGGMLCGHDYGRRSDSEPRRAVDDRFGDAVHSYVHTALVWWVFTEEVRDEKR